MELFEAIARRHSYRGIFKNQPVPRADLQRIVQAGIQAPSGKNEQTTTFIIVDDGALVAQIGAMHATNKAVQTAAAMIVCVIDRKPAPIVGVHSFQVEDCAAAVENMLLAATALGYASVWTDAWLRAGDTADVIGKLLNVPASKIVRVLLPIGVPEEAWQQRERKPLEERAWFNRYGG